MEHKTKKIILFVNGELPAPKHFVSQLTNEDVLVAVDGGLAHMTRLGLTPNLIIGDLDSANRDAVQQFQAQGVEVRKYPEDKDETDLELALDAALAMNPSEIWVVAALGKRLDQTLGNIFLLTQPKLSEVDIRLVDGQREVFLIWNEANISGKIGQRVSLLPFGVPVTGIHTEGLKYPLAGETLYPERTRGISNEMTASSAKVFIGVGMLLCIHETKNPSQRRG